MSKKKLIFDEEKARGRIIQSGRAGWWKRAGSKEKGFTYTDKDDAKITDEKHLERIKKLVIPPAWKYVRIARSPRSDLQSIGMDESGRVQYLYSDSFRKKRERKKFEKIEKFGDFLPNLRERTNQDIALEGFPKEKVLAVMMRLINSLYMRIGSQTSVDKYRTYGITTLRNNHLTIGRDGKLTFDFIGKHHIKQKKIMVDEELADILRHLRKIGSKKKLFAYLDEDGKPHPIKPQHLNQYIKEITSPEFSAKDFRTWGGTLLAALELTEIGHCEDETEMKKKIVEAVKNVSEHLGNTPAVCRSSYIHPVVIESYEKGITLDEFTPKQQRRIKKMLSHTPEEKALIKLFQKQ